MDSFVPTETSPTFQRASLDLHTSSCAIRTVPELIEYNASQNPNYLFSIQTKNLGESDSQEFLTISHLQLEQAILRCSSWLLTTVGELKLPFKVADGSVVKCSPIALLAESDFRLLLEMLSLVSLGHTGQFSILVTLGT